MSCFATFQVKRKKITLVFFTIIEITIIFLAVDVMHLAKPFTYIEFKFQINFPRKY